MRHKSHIQTFAKFAFLFLSICITLQSFPDEKSEVSVLTGATIYSSPDESPITAGVVVIRNGRIEAVGSKEQIQIPADATILKCDGLFITAGFQNSHVHFTEQKWENAANLPTQKLNDQFVEMLTRYGFTTVVDTGSSLANTLALRNRIESGELQGPRILTAGTPIYPENGIPYYLKTDLPPEILASLPTPKTLQQAAAVASDQLDRGADIVKLFTGSWVKRGEVLPMNIEVASAAAAEAHRRGKLVFTHASNIAGLEVALKAKVDVIAHALDDDRGFTDSHFAQMKANNMSMIPTLKLFKGPPYFKFILKEVGDFFLAGGQILFGTDVGYMRDYDPSDEYDCMAQAGLKWNDILASLTTAPAEKFGEAKRRGRVATGMDADLVVLASDPAKDVKAFSNVRYVIRAGHIINRAN
ncbi:amidohydrolase family protein [bacterium]|nr:amidohydrolase family protein [bacterium]